MSTRTPPCLALLSVLCFTTEVHTQVAPSNAPAITTETAAIARLRDLFYRQDYVGGADEGAPLSRRFPKSREVLAWRLVHMTRADGPDEALKSADSMITANRRDAWGWFAKSIALQYRSDATAAPIALAASLEAYKRLPSHTDVQWVRAFTLSNNQQAPWALALLDSLAHKRPLTADQQVLYADALFTTARMGGKVNTAKVDSAIAIYERVRASSPNNASAYAHAASTLIGGGRSRADAYNLAKRAVEIEPAARAHHLVLWDVIRVQKDRTDSSRYAETLADAETLLRLRGHSAIVMYGVSGEMGDIGQPDRQRTLEDRVLTEFPHTASAEWVLIYRSRRLAAARRDSANHDTTLATRYKQSVWAFVDRHEHLRPNLLGESYLNLFFLMDSTTPPDTVLRVVRGMVKYEQLNPHTTFAAGAVMLADRRIALPEAEQIARAGLQAAKKMIASRRSSYETIGDYQHALDYYNSLMYDAIGWVYYREGRVADAERELTQARDLEPRNALALVHLGDIARSKNDLAAAERSYMKAALVQGYGGAMGKAALRALYVRRTGSDANYDTYLASIEDTDRAARKSDIAASKIANPTPLKAFSLTSLDGEVITPKSLQGKVAVINLWGTWCGPCVAEMPEFQKLSEKYAGDSSVRILTIDKDDDVSAFRKWMIAKKYTFTTLLDDGFTARAGILSWPTTWFVDPDGHVTYVKRGSSEKLVEEFGWRIESLRRPATVP